MRTLMESLTTNTEVLVETTVLVDGNVTLDNFERTDDSEVFTATANGFGSTEGSEDYNADIKDMNVTIQIDAFGDISEGEFKVVSITSDGVKFAPMDGFTMGEAMGVDADDLVSASQTESVEEAMGPMANINDAGEIEMTKADYAKIHRDYKTKIDDTYMALRLDHKTGGTVLTPVKFIESMYEADVKKVCRDCGDEMHKPTTDCSHDCNDMTGENWVTEEAKPDFADIDKDGDKEEDMKKAANDMEDKNLEESPTMDTTQLVSMLHSAGLSEEAIEKKITEWANSPANAGETEPTSHGDPYEFAQPVNLSLKRYMDAEDMKVSVTEHTVDNMKSLYEASKNKPDFLDIDKDGDTDEDMKDAAEDVKEAVACNECECDPCECDTLEESQSPAQKAAFAKMLASKKKEPTMDDEPEYDGDKKEPSVEESLEESKELAILLKNAGL